MLSLALAEADTLEERDALAEAEALTDTLDDAEPTNNSSKATASVSYSRPYIIFPTWFQLL